MHAITYMQARRREAEAGVATDEEDLAEDEGEAPKEPFYDVCKLENETKK